MTLAHTEKDDLNKTITRCPQCQTAFRVTRRQLNAAKGAVRCGSCLTVFKAYDYITTQDDENDVPKRDDDLISDGLALDKEFLSPSAKRSHSLFEQAPKKEFTETESADESWAVDLLAELEDDDDIRPIVINRKKAQQQPKQPITPRPAPTPPVNPKPVSAIDQQTTKPNSELSPDDNQSVYITNKQSMLDTIETAPVELNWQPPTRFKALWIVGSLVAMLIIVIQVAIFRFDTLSIEDAYRPWYAKACNIFGCTLPNRSDTRLITTQSTRIKKQDDDSLTVITIINNAAKFEQPYPNLVVSLSNIQGKVIAERYFTPDQYLNTEVKQTPMLPAGRDAQVSFTIADPDKRYEGASVTVYR